MTSPVRAVTRAFAVLRVVVASPNGVSLAQIARVTRLPKSSVSRMLDTLQHLDMVEQVGKRGRYRVGHGLEVLAGGGTSPQVLAQLSRPHLLSLVSHLGEDATLSVPEGDNTLYVSQVTADRSVQVQDWTGFALPHNTVAPGLVFLSTWEPERLGRYLQQDLVRHTPQTLVEPAALMGRLETVRRDGYAWTHREYTEDINGVAAPVFNPHGQVVASLSVHGPSYRFPAPGEEPRIGRMLCDLAAQLTGELGGYSF
ncbi:MAG: IclR family transcriptional regulator [bacterium]|nr:IclR family transcriptional regulator [bacterium]